MARAPRTAPPAWRRSPLGAYRESAQQESTTAPAAEELPRTAVGPDEHVGQFRY